MLGQIDIVLTNQTIPLERFFHNTCRIETVKPLAAMLQNDDVGFVLDFRNRFAKTLVVRTEANKTTR